MTVMSVYCRTYVTSGPELENRAKGFAVQKNAMKCVTTVVRDERELTQCVEACLVGEGFESMRSVFEDELAVIAQSPPSNLRCLAIDRRRAFTSAFAVSGLVARGDRPIAIFVLESPCCQHAIACDSHGVHSK